MEPIENKANWIKQGTYMVETASYYVLKWKEYLEQMWKQEFEQKYLAFGGTR